MELYPFQEEAVRDLIDGKHIVVAGMGMGKTAMMMTWLKKKCDETGKSKILIVTTPSKRDSGDMTAEAKMWNGESWLSSLDKFEVISWHGLKKWTQGISVDEAKEYVFGFDEIAKASAGVSSGMGKAFLQITKVNDDWAGFTGTPGDTWIKFYPYFQATGLVKHKTAFLNKYVTIETYKGYPEIIGYKYEDEMRDMWSKISTAPDTKVVEEQLPEETRKVIHFKKPKGYDKVIHTRLDDKGELLETTIALCHYLRQLCFTKEKRQWVSDFIENLGTNAVFFCNYIEEEDTVCEIAEKVLPKGAKVWRIDGKHHDIPTAESIGKYDIVVAHYASGGEALNLQFMNYWVAVSPNYSYSTSKQAEGRIRRIGQKKNMFFFILYCCDTIESDIMKCLSAKKDFAERTWCLERGLSDEDK